MCQKCMYINQSFIHLHWLSRQSDLRSDWFSHCFSYSDQFNFDASEAEMSSESNAKDKNEDNNEDDTEYKRQGVVEHLFLVVSSNEY